VSFDHFSSRGEPKGLPHARLLFCQTQQHWTMQSTLLITQLFTSAEELLLPPWSTWSVLSLQPHHPASPGQRSQSQTTQQAKSQPLPGHRRSHTEAHVSSAPSPPQSTQVNNFGSEDVPESGIRSSFPHAFERQENLSSH
jgi:hypothetical protein